MAHKGNKLLRFDGRNVATTIVGTGAHEDGFAGDGGPAGFGLTRDVPGTVIHARGNVDLTDGYKRRLRAMDEVAK